MDIWIGISEGTEGPFVVAVARSMREAQQVSEDNEPGDGTGWTWDRTDETDDLDRTEAINVSGDDTTRLHVQRADLARHDDGPAPDVSGEVAELRHAAQAITPNGGALSLATANLLETAADRLAAHPKAQGGMTQAALRIARSLS